MIWFPVCKYIFKIVLHKTMCKILIYNCQLVELSFSKNGTTVIKEEKPRTVYICNMKLKILYWDQRHTLTRPHLRLSVNPLVTLVGLFSTVTELPPNIYLYLSCHNGYQIFDKSFTSTQLPYLHSHSFSVNRCSRGHSVLILDSGCLVTCRRYPLTILDHLGVFRPSSYLDGPLTFLSPEGSF